MSLNLYLEQQRIEDLEDKYAELKRKHELLKAENQLLKAGNYNLKRANDVLKNDVYNLRIKNIEQTNQFNDSILREKIKYYKMQSMLQLTNNHAFQLEQKLKNEQLINELAKNGNYNLHRDNNEMKNDVYNLRLENSKLSEEFANLSKLSNDKITILERKYEELKNQLENVKPKTNLLPKVAEKEEYKQFMLDCCIMESTKFPDHIKYLELKQKVECMVESILADDDEYIVCNSWNVKTTNLCGLREFILTNKGKMFFKTESMKYNDNVYQSYCADFRVCEMNLQLIDGILRKFLMNNKNGYRKYDIESGSSLHSELPIIQTGKYAW